ncbi:uncharacterized protein H6S33_010979 [Morchella sextelata]|uniref:uncharacterized protein n=1 Tax=Morchella sextelata TaxID=1174677 RepID=UPI001D050A0A|nr:uncharacterized protein H6S33_010979 [Morchella sextelata]KAH0611714.1 hypothetical protein H6S33_010979 [Morchella sextelata]
MFSRPPSSDGDRPSASRSPTHDPRSPRNPRRVIYTFSPLALPLASNIERLESAPLVSQAQIDALYEACHRLILTVSSRYSPSEISSSRQSFTVARNAIRSTPPDGTASIISWLDHSSTSPDHSLPFISPTIISRSSGSISVHSTDNDEESIYNASVISESEMERMEEEERIISERDWEMLQEIPVPIAHAQVIWMMRLDEYDDEMVLQGMRGVSYRFARRDT